MRLRQLRLRSLVYYWRTNVAVIAGVAVAVTVLAGSLLVGESVRASLRALVLARLGATETVINSAGFFREKLVEAFSPAAPLIVLEGVASPGSGPGRRAGGVAVYAVDERFWRFHGRPPRAIAAGEALISEALARELELQAGDALVIRVEQHADIPLESLYGRREEAGRALRLTVAAVLAAGELGEFALRPQQGAVRALFANLGRVQRDLKREGRVNAILTGPGDAAGALRQALELEDLGVKIRVLHPQRALSVEKESTLLDDGLARPLLEIAARHNWRTHPLFAYMVNTIRVRGRELPYSMIAATPEAAGLELTDWAAQDLAARAGDSATLEYYVWRSDRGLATARVELPVAAVVPLSRGDRDIAPEYPGITDSAQMSDWDPPFPLDLNRIRKKDEDFWEHYRATPKAFLPLSKGQELWQSRFGNLTSIRVFPGPEAGLAAARDTLRSALRAELDPAAMGISVYAVRSQGLAASRGATDFGEYFVYFNSFLVVSALLLAGMFFRLGIQQRRREIGLLRATGFPPATIRSGFLREGLALSALGGAVGVAGSVGYAGFMIWALQHWWVDAVGTTLLELHLSRLSLAAGLGGGIAVAMAVIALTLRELRGLSPRELVTGSLREEIRRAGKPARRVAWTASGGGLALLGGAALGRVPAAAGFFGAGALLLIAFLAVQWIWLTARGAAAHSVAGLGWRTASYRPGRSVLSMALIASATFIIVSVDAFRRGAPPAGSDPRSGQGGFAMLAESLTPLVDPPAIEGVRFVPFRLRPGDDASCLNLYEPRNPRILGAPAPFLREGRFAFQAALAEPENPWLLLEDDPGDGAVPAIADANSLTYVLHRKLGEEFAIEQEGRRIRLRLVAALADSVFQSELIISEQNFLRLFPEIQGYRFFLLEGPPAAAATVEETYSDRGLDVSLTADRLATFHRVENTYISTFQTLGGLGLLLGTAGLAAVLLRNVLEQRRELALLRATGFRSVDLAKLVLAENTLLLLGGLVSGLATALLAIAPALAQRGGGLPRPGLLAAVVLAGLASSILAVVAVARLPVLSSLRSE